jgi:tetratricopeptide (TPR) repeat protein
MVWATAALSFLLLQVPQANPAAEGLKALEEQRWDAAVISLTKAAEADPKNYAIHFNLAFGLSMANRLADSIREYRTTLELKPGLYEAQLNLGMLLLQEKKAAEAATLLEAAALQKPEQFRPAWYAAEALLEAGQPARAIPHFRKAVELDPKSKDAAIGLARALAKDGKLAEAEPLYRKVAEATPETLLELATLLEAAGRAPEAAEIYAKFPDNPAARERAGEILLESGKAADAIPQLEASVKQSPTPANRFALAMAYNVTKQFDKAEPLFAQALKDEPNNLSLRMSYARVLREQRKYGPAAQEFARVATAKPDSAEAWSDLAGMLILLENHAQALAALDRVRALNAEKPAHHYFRAIILDKNKLHEQALASYEKFLETSGGKNPDEEFKARQRVRIIKREREKR